MTMEETMNTTALTMGSVAHVAKSHRQTLAEAFLGVDAIAIVDTSGSMNESGRGMRTKWMIAQDELAQLQREMPGKVAVVSFSDTPTYQPNGALPLATGGTALHKALEFVLPADGTGLRFIVVSDGLPDDEIRALDVARRFTSRIDTIYVGPEWETGAQDFLRRLAGQSGGTYQIKAYGKQLAPAIQQLLLTAGKL